MFDLLSDTPIVWYDVIEVPGQRKEKECVPKQDEHEFECAGGLPVNATDHPPTLGCEEVRPAILEALHPGDSGRVHMRRCYHSHGTEGHTNCESWEEVEDSPHQLNWEGIFCCIVVKEHMIDILLREHDLEDDSDKHEYICQLVGLSLGRHDCRDAECETDHGKREEEEYTEGYQRGHILKVIESA